MHSKIIVSKITNESEVKKFMEFSMYENGFQTDAEYGELIISSQGKHGFRPYELLVSSVVGCSGGTLRKVLKKMRLPFYDLKVSAQVKRNPVIANRIEEIHLNFMIYGENLPPEKVRKALAVTRKNCAMIQSVKDSIEITDRFEIKDHVK
jgi:uncharacterized OsmC-like protein